MRWMFYIENRDAAVAIYSKSAFQCWFFRQLLDVETICENASKFFIIEYSLEKQFAIKCA